MSDVCVFNCEIPLDMHFSVLFSHCLSAENLQHEAGSDSRTDDAGDVGTHCMHEQIVARIRLLAFHLADTGSHRNRGDAG